MKTEYTPEEIAKARKIVASLGGQKIRDTRPDNYFKQLAQLSVAARKRKKENSTL